MLKDVSLYSVITSITPVKRRPHRDEISVLDEAIKGHDCGLRVCVYLTHTHTLCEQTQLQQDRSQYA